MTNDQKKSIEKIFDGKDWSRSSFNSNVVIDKNKNRVGNWQSEETFNWRNGGKTSGYSETAAKAKKS